MLIKTQYIIRLRLKPRDSSGLAKMLLLLYLLAVACAGTDGSQHLQNASAQLVAGLRRQLLKDNYDYYEGLSLDGSREQGPPPPNPGPTGPKVDKENHHGPVPPPIDKKDFLYYMEDARTRGGEVRDGDWNTGGRRIPEEHGAEGDGQPLPEFRQPHSRRQYMIETDPQLPPRMEQAPPPPEPPHYAPFPENPSSVAPVLTTLEEGDSDDWNVADFEQYRRSGIANDTDKPRLTIQQYRNLVLSPLELAGDNNGVNQTQQLAPDPDPDWIENKAPAPSEDNERRLVPSDMSISGQNY